MVKEIIEVRQSVTAVNDRTAMALRRRFYDSRVGVLNLVSAPGAGKTTLIEKTVQAFQSEYAFLVIEGDPYTSLDTDRVNAMGAKGVQINTGAGCHLDAGMVEKVLIQEDFSSIDIIIIENVGNLLCPAAWDLGQNRTGVVASLTEGEDKPLKYPETFIRSDAMVINKIDLAPYLPSSAERLSDNALKINPRLEVFPVSCLTGEGLDGWFRWIRNAIIQDRA